MKEISLNILDITHNSITAKATEIEIEINEKGNVMDIVIKDNGCGMSKELLASVIDPFTTSRTTRKVGMGIPLYKMAAEQTGGFVKIESTLGVGTTVTAEFVTDSIDCPPLGDISGSLVLLMSAIDNDSRLVYKHTKNDKSFSVDTKELRGILGDEISFSEPEVAAWLKEYLTENETEIM